MLVPLDKIKPSPHPVRTSWDEDKMDELAQSIKSQGQVMPIVLNLVNGQYKIEDGHRRVEACRRAGLTEVEAWGVEVDDLKFLIRSGIANIQREDLSVLMKAEWCAEILKRTKWSANELSRQTGIPSNVISHWRTFLSEYNVGAVPRGIVRENVQDQGREKTLHIKRAFDKVGIDKPELRRKVAEKTINLTRDQTRKVADAVAHAKDDAERQAILETEYEHVVTMPAFVRAKAQAKRNTAKREKKKRQEEPREVAKYLDAVRAFTGELEEAVAVAKFGKFSPEAARFVKARHDKLRQLLDQLENAMEDGS